MSLTDDRWLYQDERVMDFDRSVLYDMWEELYEYISKKAAIDRKIWLKGLLQSHPPKGG